MKEIISKATNKREIISDSIWDNIVSRGWAKKFDVIPIKERTLGKVPIIIIEPPEISEMPPEVKTKTKKKNG
jgi:hypothetical protein